MSLGSSDILLLRFTTGFEAVDSDIMLGPGPRAKGSHRDVRR